MTEVQNVAEHGFTELLNRQLESEYAARQQYIALAVWFHALGMTATSSYFLRQSEQENEHAWNLITFMLEYGHSVTVPGVRSVENSFDGLVAAFGQALTQEKQVGDDIGLLLYAARREGAAEERAFVERFFADHQLEIGSISQLVSYVQRNEDDPHRVDAYVAGLAR